MYKSRLYKFHNFSINEEISIRSPKWLRNHLDFEFNTGKDVQPEAKEKRKKIEDEELSKKIFNDQRNKKWNDDWKIILEAGGGYNYKGNIQNYFLLFLREKNMFGKYDDFYIKCREIKKSCEKSDSYVLINDFRIWLGIKKSNEEKQRREEEKKKKNIKEEEERLYKELGNLYDRMVSDWSKSPYKNKVSSKAIGRDLYEAKYVFETGESIRFLDNGVNKMEIYFIDSSKNSASLLLSGKGFRQKFIDLINSMARSGKSRPSDSRNDYRNDNRNNNQSNRNYNSNVDSEPTKTGDVKKDKYNLLNYQIKKREDDIRKLNKNDSNRPSLENELNSYKRVRDKMKKEYKFENMKYIKYFEGFNKILTLEQEEDLSEIFFEYIKDKKVNYEKAHFYFVPGSDRFAEFLKHLEDETEWFDYSQVDSILIEIESLLSDLEEFETSEDEFAEDDEEYIDDEEDEEYI